MNLLGSPPQSSDARNEAELLDQSNPSQSRPDHLLSAMAISGEILDEDTLADFFLTASLLAMLGLVAVYGVMSS